MIDAVVYGALVAFQTNPLPRELLRVADTAVVIVFRDLSAHRTDQCMI